jgi:hypothetical protein
VSQAAIPPVGSRRRAAASRSFTVAEREAPAEPRGGLLKNLIHALNSFRAFNRRQQHTELTSDALEVLIMSPVDTMMPLLQGPWIGRAGEQLSIVPLPALRHEAVNSLESHWAGVLTPEMRQVLQLSCGLSGTPLGNIDFTGRWYPQEPLYIFRRSLTLAIDAKGRRWIAEVGRNRGLPGPVWCVFPRPEVVLFVDRSLADFLARLHDNVRRGSTSQYLTTLDIRARTLWASRHARAMGMPVAFSRLRELRGWLAGLPLEAWVYDLRAPGARRGLPYGLARERGNLVRCGRLPVFAFVGSAVLAAKRVDRRVAAGTVGSSSSSPPS